ncbi:MAG: hypothetical protein CVU47_02915 [Chloroflexi bacterium HGW-Chloroflexi-9]|nr:MAG: hypothetical protein CVU47_02915 [Chloroflexi bacterium HGW-Chloroflexi-9]
MVLAVDLFVNAGLLVNVYDGEDSALLSNVEAAKRIPVAYAVWAVQMAALQWLLTRLDVRRLASAAAYGATASLLSGGLSLVALWTIVRLDPLLTVAWIVAAVVEGAVAGATLAHLSQAGARGLRSIAPLVLVVVIAAFVLQNVLKAG